MALERVTVSAVEEMIHGHRQRQHRIEGEKRNISGSGSGSGSRQQQNHSKVSNDEEAEVAALVQQWQRHSS
jgi:hypothetical protein